MPAHRDRPLRAAMARAAVLCEFGRRAEALAEVKRARRNTPFDGRDLSSDEAAALAEGWELQAADDLHQGQLEAGLEDLAIAEQILDRRPEHGEQRGHICVQIAAQMSASTPELRSIRAEYLGLACYFLEGSDKYRDLLETLRHACSGECEQRTGGQDY